jgi:hypothetical protein
MSENYLSIYLSIYLFIYLSISILRSEVGVLEREHAVKVEAPCVLILLDMCRHTTICVLIPLYIL